VKTLLALLEKAGGWNPGLHLKISNPPFMELVIEAMDESGPCGLPSISVAHYGVLNGDLMRDPEMCFEIGASCGLHLNPFFWRNDYVGIEQWSRDLMDGVYRYRPALHRQHEQFAALWDNNLREQGFLEVAAKHR
jgi:hypothetical protein